MSEQMLQVFSFDEAQVRTVVKDGEPWFVAADVCQVLNIGNPSDVIKRIDSDDVTLGQIEGSHRPTNLVNESGLYSLILRSDKPEAKKFKKWVTSEVLPSIRKSCGMAECRLPVRRTGSLRSWGRSLDGQWVSGLWRISGGRLMCWRKSDDPRSISNHGRT